MTNADKIRSMSNQELAKLIISGEWSCICPFCNYQYTGLCRFDEEGNETGNKDTCEKGAMEFLETRVN